jgi:hypothetical protein
MFDRERHDLLEKQLRDAGATIRHYGKDQKVSYSKEQVVIIFIDQGNNRLTLSWSFQDSCVDYMIVRTNSFEMGYISFEEFLNVVPEEYKEIFVFYLDLFDAKYRWA